VESLEGMLKERFAEATQPTKNLIDSIQSQLNSLTDQIKLLQNSSPPSLPTNQPGHHIVPPPPPPPPPGPKVKIENVNLTHSTNHIEAMDEEYLTQEEEADLMTFFEGEDFATEGNRLVALYGVNYKYMGSKSQAKPTPKIIQDIMDRLNNTLCKSNKDSRLHYTLNSCLVNCYPDCDSFLKEHSDNEGDINPLSSIFTVSLGDTRTVKFRNLHGGDLKEVPCKGRSLYSMTRNSQDFWKHSVEKDPNISAAVRYSLTFRSIHWSNFNSTALIGDSNFGPINFGSGKGKLGASTPGSRFWCPTIDKVDPLEYTSFKNVVLMVGTNNLKLEEVDDKEIKELYKLYKTKVSQIRKYNPRCKLFICPILPSKLHNINRKVFKFNSYLYNDLCQSNLSVTLVEGFEQFFDNSTNLLRSTFSRPSPDDVLHLNDRGIKVLVSLIKRAIFYRKNTHNNPVDRRLFSNVLRGGPPSPVR
jgi:alkylated DNA repair dioxygenase AlkB